LTDHFCCRSPSSDSTPNPADTENDRSAGLQASIDKTSEELVPISTDVFISHRGPDVKTGFVSHLVNRLHGSNVSTFVDYELRPGSPAWPQIQACLRAARVQLVIISPDFAGSWWCLEELRIAMQTRSRVLPIFWGTKPGSFRRKVLEKSFAKMQGDLPETPDERLDEWMSALSWMTGVAGVTGYEHTPGKGWALPISAFMAFRGSQPLESRSC
jgi:hypothetical protein